MKNALESNRLLGSNRISGNGVGYRWHSGVVSFKRGLWDRDDDKPSWLSHLRLEHSRGSRTSRASVPDPERVGIRGRYIQYDRCRCLPSVLRRWRDEGLTS